MLDPALQLALRERPEGPFAMLQNWRDLSFLHFSIEPEVVQRMLPEGLTVDTFPDANGVEKAWIGFVPFRMQDIRFRSLPKIPGFSRFPETNVRTYVHRNGKRPGVWFFSLDAANGPACWFARKFFNLPYFKSVMRTQRVGNRIVYLCLRYGPLGGRAKATATTVVDVGDEMPTPKPGSLEFFLVERYLLYAVKGGKLFTGQVHHEPYPLKELKVLQCQETLLSAAGLQEQPWEHVCFSEGVNVEIFSLRAEE